jgi:gliding motility-associated-like protein
VLSNKLIIVYPLPVPGAAPDTVICLGGQVQLRSGDGDLYQWTAAPGLTDLNIANPVLTPTVTSQYQVKVTNRFGCVQTDTVAVQVDEPVALRVSASDSICAGERIQLTATSTVNNYLWSPPAGLSSTTSAAPFASPAVTTTYRVVGVSSNVCKSDTGYVTVAVGNRPLINAGADRNIAAGTVVQLSVATTATDIRTYTWMPATGLDCINCTTPKFTADQDIVYRVTAETNYGCRATDEVRIVVFCNKGQLFIPNAFSPNGDGLNDIFYIKGYGIATIKRLMIFNRYGQLVFQRQQAPVNTAAAGWDGRVNGSIPSSTENFVYVLEVICKDGQAFNYKGNLILVK